MSLEQLESFVVVAEEGHLTRAAGRLHISQPPLTRRIQALESELGVQLFARTPQGMQLLPAGHELLTRARGILAEVAATTAHLGSFRSPPAPTPSPSGRVASGKTKSPESAH